METHLAPLVSVIVPVYNAEKYICTLIDSVLAQSFTDFELLLIDDGSKDSSPQILDKYAVKDRRVRAIHKENGGAGSARNMGLDQACGTFIVFADSDDYMFPDNLQTMIDEIGDHDLLICNMQGGLRDGINLCQRQSKKSWEITANSIDEMADVIPRIGYRNYVVWNQMFRRSIIERHYIRFENINSEDELFSFTYFSRVSSLKRIDYEGYYYVDTPNSLGSSHKYIVEMDWIGEMENIYESIERKYPLPMSFFHTVNHRIAIRLVSLCLKGYHKDSYKPLRGRIDTWRDVGRDSWLRQRICLSRLPRRYALVLFVLKLKLFYLIDPIILLLVQRKDQNKEYRHD